MVSAVRLFMSLMRFKTVLHLKCECVDYESCLLLLLGLPLSLLIFSRLVPIGGLRLWFIPIPTYRLKMAGWILQRHMLKEWVPGTRLSWLMPIRNSPIMRAIA